VIEKSVRHNLHSIEYLELQFCITWFTINHLIFNYFREKEEKEQQNLSLMLMFVVMVFMLCNVLAMVSNILEAFKVRKNSEYMLFGCGTLLPRSLHLSNPPPTFVNHY
jgi:hypothetical protein